MFKDFELPFVPTLVVGCMLLVAVCVIWDIPGHPVEAMNSMQAMDAELIGNSVVVDRDRLTPKQRDRIMRLAQMVWESRPEYDPSKALSIEFTVPSE